MQKVNYKSDFDIVLRLLGCTCGPEPMEIGWPDFDWEARLFTDAPSNPFVASCRGGVCRGCFNDGGKIHIVVKNHHIGLGRLKIEFKALLPNKIYPDGIQKRVEPQPLEIELVRGRGDCGGGLESEIYTAWYFIHDTDVYNSVLESVNKALEELLAGNVKPPASDGEVVARTPKGDPMAGVVLRRGIMPSGAMPGEVYDGYIDIFNAWQKSVVIKISEWNKIQAGEDQVLDISHLFGAHFTPEDIVHTTDNEVTIDGDKVTITVKGRTQDENETKRPIIYLNNSVEIQGARFARSHFLSVNTKGQLVVVPEAAFLHAKTADVPNNAFIEGGWSMVNGRPRKDFAGISGGRPWYCCAVVNGPANERYEAQWRRVTHTTSVKELLLSGEKTKESGKKLTRWRHFTKWRRCGVFRIRRRTRSGAVSAWAYFTTYIGYDNRRHVKRI